MLKSFESKISASALAMALVFSIGGTLLSTTAAESRTQTGALSACQKGQVGQDGRCTDSNAVVQATPAPDHGVPAVLCRAGYFPIGTRLCMTAARPAASFANAMLFCMDLSGRVADYHDWRYRNQRGDGVGAPVGWWLGPITADNTALFVNLPGAGDFDGETSRFDSRFYACAHDRF
jgi:hypothetical protein